MEEIRNIGILENIAGLSFSSAMNLFYLQKEGMENAKRNQQKALIKLLSKACKTDFGKYHHFAEILKYKNNIDILFESFKKEVPLFHYGNIFETWWQPILDGKLDVCWPGKIRYIAITSATSTGHNKQIPVSDELIRNTKNISRAMIACIPKQGVPHGALVKSYFYIGGSTTLEDHANYKLGFFSGIMQLETPTWFQELCKPAPNVHALKKYTEKRDEILKYANTWDVGIVSGFPIWIVSLLEEIVDYFKVSDIHQLWPNLELYQHGGMQIAPYLDRLDKVLGRPIAMMNSYVASEGFFAFTKQKGGSLELVNTDEFFYEFIEMKQANFDENGIPNLNIETIALWQVLPQVEYAMVVTNCSGAWRYIIGDTIIFENTSNFSLRFAGRTALFLNVCGENISMVQLENAMKSLSIKLGMKEMEYTVTVKQAEKKWEYQWYVSDKINMVEGVISDILDQSLIAQNMDYQDARKIGVISGIKVIKIPEKRFLQFLQRPGKDNAQLKFPRVLKGQALQDWEAFIKDNFVP
jgi:GH3 auxin-responsive promoter